MFCVVNKKDTLIKSEDKISSAKVASEIVKENVEIAPPSPYANNDTFDATNDEFNDDYNEDVTDEVLEEKDDLVQIDVEDIKGLFLSEDTDVFIITPNRRTFYFPETENLNFSDRKLLRN